MDEINYLVLYADGGFGVMPIGDADDDEIFRKLMKVFATDRGYFYDNYQTDTLCVCSAQDVSALVELDGANDTLKAFASSLQGHGFELFICWHEHSRELHDSGVYKNCNMFFEENSRREKMFGPVVLRAQVYQDDAAAAAVEVSASVALYVAEKIVNAKLYFDG
ncbi:unnamed protein product [Ectocarpus sp. 6 AP-2014]